MYRNENENYDIFLSSAPDVRPENYDTFPYYDLLVCRIKGVKCDKITFSSP